jgi:hypothetical protein
LHHPVERLREGVDQKRFVNDRAADLGVLKFVDDLRRDERQVLRDILIDVAFVVELEHEVVIARKNRRADVAGRQTEQIDEELRAVRGGRERRIRRCLDGPENGRLPKLTGNQLVSCGVWSIPSAASSKPLARAAAANSVALSRR